MKKIISFILLSANFKSIFLDDPTKNTDIVFEFCFNFSISNLQIS